MLIEVEEMVTCIQLLLYCKWHLQILGLVLRQVYLYHQNTFSATSKYCKAKHRESKVEFDSIQNYGILHVIISLTTIPLDYSKKFKCEYTWVVLQIRATKS